MICVEYHQLATAILYHDWIGYVQAQTCKQIRADEATFCFTYSMVVIVRFHVIHNIRY